MLKPSSSFMKRFWTTVILLPIVLWLLLAANPWVLGVLTLGMILWAGIEWLAFIPVHRMLLKILFMVGLLAAIWLSLSPVGYWLGLCFWGLLFVAVLTYPASQVIWGHNTVVALLAYVLLPLALWSATALYQYSSQGRMLCIYVLCLVCSSDIGAYLTGKCWGRHRLIPRVSPGKTWEGALCADSLSGFFLSEKTLYAIV
jgi:phosphatidate cytidylyltransferase